VSMFREDYGGEFAAPAEAGKESALDGESLKLKAILMDELLMADSEADRAMEVLLDKARQIDDMVEKVVSLEQVQGRYLYDGLHLRSVDGQEFEVMRNGLVSLRMLIAHPPRADTGANEALDSMLAALEVDLHRARKHYEALYNSESITDPGVV
jgi:hypothetical protein